MLTDTNRDLLCRLTDLLRCERAALADFLVALAEFDRRRAWGDLGYASLFDFLHRELGLSKGTAFYRKTAAELVQRYPEVVEPLRDGRLCLTSVVELAKVITPDNRTEVLPRFFHCSRQEAKTVSAELSPVLSPPLRVVVTSLPAPCSVDLAQAVQSLNQQAETSVPVASTGAEQQKIPALSVRDTAEPLTSDLRRLHITVSKRFLGKLDAARSALSHSIPGAATEQLLEAALDLVLANDARRKGLVAKPRSSPATPPEPGDRYVPAAVRRAVWKRDGGKCQWPLESGGICGSTYQVELDHTRPSGQGGRSTIGGTRLLCRPHNDVAARLAFGDAWMDRFTRRQQDPRPLPSHPSAAKPT
jgi:hypothetical protein